MRGSLILFLFLSACASPKDETPARGIEPFVRFEEALIENAGLWQFNKPLKGISSNEHYVIEGLFLKPEAKIILHSHMNGFAWRDGVQVGFRRSDNGAIWLDVLVPGYTTRSHELPKEFVTSQVGSSRVDLQACKLEYSIVSPK